jgi:hypothetical protein
VVLITPAAIQSASWCLVHLAFAASVMNAAATEPEIGNMT